MPVKISEEIRNAIRKAVDDAGSQLAFQRLSGISQRNVSRYIAKQNLNLSDRMWRDIFPYLKKYLPDNYECSMRPRIEANIVNNHHAEALKYCMTILNQDAIPDKVKVDLVRQYIESILK